MTYAFPISGALLIGPTGSGKTPVGQCIERHGIFGSKAHHFDFGAELRAAASCSASAHYTQNELAFLHGVLEHGLLLENEHFPLAVKILSLFLQRVRFRSSDILVLNGFPRHAGQSTALAPYVSVRALFVLDCSPDTVTCRLRNNIGGDRSNRCDDHEDLVVKKLNIFYERTAPLIAQYSASGCPIVRIAITERTTAEDAYCMIASSSSTNPPFPLVTEPPQR